jgi:hypothetical protein
MLRVFSLFCLVVVRNRECISIKQTLRLFFRLFPIMLSSFFLIFIHNIQQLIKLLLFAIMFKDLLNSIFRRQHIITKVTRLFLSLRVFLIRKTSLFLLHLLIIFGSSIILSCTFCCLVL